MRNRAARPLLTIGCQIFDGAHSSAPHGTSHWSRSKSSLSSYTARVTDAPPCSVLVVDADRASAELTELLRKEGYSVVSTTNGRDGLRELRRQHFDVVVLDLQLPIVDGWSFRADQKRDPNVAVIPVIVHTADRSPQAEAVDAAAFLPKPSEAPLLLSTIRQVLLNADRERARAAQLAQADRLASLGMLAAGVAHEINNPLAYITANLTFVADELAVLERRLPDGTLRDVRDAIIDSRDGAERIRKIVRDLRCFSRQDQEEKRAIDVHPVLEVAINMSWNVIRHRGRLIKDYGVVPSINGDEARLAQLFINLLVNAAQALPEGAALHHEIRILTSLVDEQTVAIEVRDTGRGIPSADLGRIFEPFFTTKKPGEGTGLGLPIALEIVRSHGGRLEVESQVGKGTTFRVLLPVATVREHSSLHPRSAVGVRRGRVLVVDDEELVCKALARGLASEHDVTTLTDPRQALELLQQGEKFDAIFCDLMMPAMTGIELYTKLRASAPDAAERIVFLTGGAFTPSARKFLEQVPNPRIEKPFDVQNIRSLLRDRLRQPRPLQTTAP